MTLRLTWKRVLASLAALAAAGLLFAWSGLFPLAATTGHWAVTEWFLHWTMQNSARTYSAFQTPEHVRDDDALTSAAGHFRQACQVCHGAPGEAPSPAMQSATPHAPDLARTVTHYSDRELFWIVTHGVKYTGMPAWPTQDRPDEVRRMVGFLRQLPTMDAGRYAQLSMATSDVAISPPLVRQCAGCHGSDGLGHGQPDIPIIAGQKRAHLYTALRRYASGVRHSGPMQVAAATLTDSEMQALATHYAQLPGLHDTPLDTAHPLVKGGDRARQLPACARCHAPGKTAPILAGQRADYLADRLRAWQGDKTVIDLHKSQLPMPVIARRIPEDQIEPLARALSQGSRQTPP
ncbi:c-type cytochrome [Novosphingobium sp. BW1]|uniref:c-type cytochrome n=1 Tax=Novosphingobium sp. BW1 TaxID=2592621 RepID=UPI0011DE716E|nr:c-type cytochrome [Novosphingobium sp. BW1]TYC90426.1 cytochrome C [Novosphingobium sp. BW1]